MSNVNINKRTFKIYNLDSSEDEIEKDNQEEKNKTYEKEEKKGKGSKKGRKLKTLSAIQKKELCEYKSINPNISYEEIAKKFEIGKSTVCGILKNKDKWLAISENPEDANKKRERECEWPKLEASLALWVNQANNANHTVSDPILIQKAKGFAKKLDIFNFKASQVSIYFIIYYLYFLLNLLINF
jgi:hypothetical protein